MSLVIFFLIYFLFQNSVDNIYIYIYIYIDNTDFGNKSHRYIDLQQIFRDRYKNRKNRENCEVKVNLKQIITG